MQTTFRLLVILGLVLTFPCFNAFSQVSININGSPPDPSAGLDVNFNNKGLLPPRLTFEQRNAIPDPVEGLLVYCTTCNADGTGGVSVFQGGSWKMINLDCYNPNTPLAGIHNSEVNQIIWNWNTVPIAAGYKWNSVNDYGNAIDLGSSTSKTETGLTCWTGYTRYVWAYNSCGPSSRCQLSQETSQILFSPAPAAGTHDASPNQIVWNWTASSGATGYRWSTSNNFATATAMGTATMKTETGLACGTAFTRYVWAYDGCGSSTPTILTQSTLSTLASPAAGMHVASGTQIVWNWDAVTGATGYKWNSVNTYATATDMGTGRTKTETGLTPNTTYIRYVWAYNSCGVSSSTALIQTLVYIGQSYGGGIVFYIDGTGQHGLISATSDQPSTAWGCSGTLISGTSTAIGTGQANTTRIVNGCSESGIAARICNDLTLNGYSDWFLPSLSELIQMYQQRTAIGGFTETQYWSSSEQSGSYAKIVLFTTLGGSADVPKTSSTQHVRAIRAF